MLRSAAQCGLGDLSHTQDILQACLPVDSQGRLKVPPTHNSVDAGAKNRPIRKGQEKSFDVRETKAIVDDEKTLIITEIADPNNSSTTGRYVEIYNSSNKSVDLSTYYLMRWTNANATC